MASSASAVSLTTLDARNQCAALIRMHHQRQQSRLNLQFSHNFKQCGMEKKNLIAGFDAIGNNSGSKQGTLDRSRSVPRVP